MNRDMCRDCCIYKDEMKAKENGKSFYCIFLMEEFVLKAKDIVKACPGFYEE